MKFKAGTKVKIVGMATGHGLPMGTILTINNYGYDCYSVQENGMQFYEQDLQAFSRDKVVIEKELHEAELKYNLAKYRYQYLEETKEEELEDSAFKKYMIKKVINDKDIDDDEKSEIILKME